MAYDRYCSGDRTDVPLGMPAGQGNEMLGLLQTHTAALSLLLLTLRLPLRRETNAAGNNGCVSGLRSVLRCVSRVEPCRGPFCAPADGQRGDSWPKFEWNGPIGDVL
jgi:hypothetical protein